MKRCLVLIGVLFGLCCLTVPAASAAPVNTGPRSYPITVCSTLSISSQQVRPGQSLTVTGTNFKANASVHLILKSVSGGATYDLKTVTTNSRGSFSTTITMPDSAINAGNFNVLATSGARTGQGCPADPVQELDVLAASTSQGGSGTGSGGGTAFTGVDIAALVAAALVLIGGGALLASRGRRRSGVRV